MRKFKGFALVAFLFGVTCRAQDTPRAEASAGYSYFRQGGSGGINSNGGSFSLAGNVNNWLGVVGDWGIYHATPLGVSLNTATFLFGPRVSYRSSDRVTPFAQVLFGGGHLSAGAFGASASTTGFAFSAGGGIDLGVSKHIAFRPQFDYIGIRSGTDTLNSFRGSFGVVFRFGR
jgi:Outer membrane protein beta-barrel domain